MDRRWFTFSSFLLNRLNMKQVFNWTNHWLAHYFRITLFLTINFLHVDLWHGCSQHSGDHFEINTHNTSYQHPGKSPPTGPQITQAPPWCTSSCLIIPITSFVSYHTLCLFTISAPIIGLLPHPWICQAYFQHSAFIFIYISYGLNFLPNVFESFITLFISLPKCFLMWNSASLYPYYFLCY